MVDCEVKLFKSGDGYLGWTETIEGVVDRRGEDLRAYRAVCIGIGLSETRRGEEAERLTHAWTRRVVEGTSRIGLNGQSGRGRRHI